MKQGDGKLAIVTGSARGIGLECARRLGQQGYHVCLTDILADEVGKAADQLRGEGISAEAHVVDVAATQTLENLPEKIGSRFETLAVLVNNAGISPKNDGGRPYKPYDIPLQEWEEVVKVNLTAPFRMMQLCLTPMRARGWGRIINVSSRAGRSPLGVAGAHYVATKTGVLGLTRSFAKAVAGDGITVNAIAPGRIETAMGMSQPAEVLKTVLANIPVGRYGSQSEVAALVAFLAGEEAGFITGAVVDINGGALMI